MWQKRKCTAKNGYLTISHGTVSKHTHARTHAGFSANAPLLFQLLSIPLLPLLQANRPPAKLNLLTCQVKHNPEEKRSFDLISREFRLLFSGLSSSMCWTRACSVSIMMLIIKDLEK